MLEKFSIHDKHFVAFAITGCGSINTIKFNFDWKKVMERIYRLQN
jgi:hypothetical protein